LLWWKAKSAISDHEKGQGSCAHPTVSWAGYRAHCFGFQTPPNQPEHHALGQRPRDRVTHAHSGTPLSFGALQEAAAVCMLHVLVASHVQPVVASTHSPASHSFTTHLEVATHWPGSQLFFELAIQFGSHVSVMVLMVCPGPHAMVEQQEELPGMSPAQSGRGVTCTAEVQILLLPQDCNHP
jgi:hypothetical protein